MPEGGQGGLFDEPLNAPPLREGLQLALSAFFSAASEFAFAVIATWLPAYSAGRITAITRLRP